MREALLRKRSALQIARRLLLSGVCVYACAIAPAFADCTGPTTDIQCSGVDIDGYTGGPSETITVQTGATVDDTSGPTIDLGNNANVTINGAVTNTDVAPASGIFISGGTLANTITVNNGGSVSSANGAPAIDISSAGGNSANTVTIGGALSSSGSVLFQGNSNTGTFTLLPTATLTNDGSAGALQGSGMGFVLGGTGTGTLDSNALGAFASYTKNTAAGWTLSGTNAQNWTVTTGVLSATNASVNNVALSSGATLNLDQNADGAYNGIVSGTGGLLTKTGTGIVTMGGVQTYTGTTMISGGALNISANNNIGAGALVLNGGTLQYGGGFSSTRATTLQAGGGTFDTNGNNSTLTGVISGTGPLTKEGAGTLTLNAVNTFTGNIAINDGTLSINNNNRLGATTNDLSFDGGILQTTAALTMSNGRNLTLNAGGGTLDSTSGALTVQGVIAGTGDLTITGAGTVVVSGTNTYTGETNINGGTLVVSNNNQLGNANSDINMNAGTLQSSGTVTMTAGRDVTLNAGGGTLNVTGGTTSVAGIIDGTGALTKSGAGTLSLTGANTYTGGTTINGGILQVTTTSLQGNVTNNATLTFSQTANGNYTGNISGTGALIKAGTGTIVLSGTNTYQGGTTINAGTLAITDDAQLGQVGDALTMNGGGLRYDAAITQSRDMVAGASGATLNTNGNNVTVDSNITGAGSLTKSGTGTLTLSGTNTYSGTTSITGGTLLATDLASLGAGGLSLAGGTFEYGSAFDMSKTLALGTGGGTLNTAGFDVELSGIVSGANLLTKAGAGELVLSGANTNTGGVTITGGSIRASANNNLGASGTLTFNGANTALNYDAAFDMARNIVFTTAGILNTDAFNSTLSGVLSGAGAVTKNGSGVLTLTNTNTYTGTTTINDGVVSVGANLNLGAATANIAMEGGTLRSTGTFTMTNGRDIALAAGGGTFETATGTTLTAQGIVSGVGTLTKEGAGVLVLSGVNTYSGGTMINDGTLQVSNNNQLGNVAGGITFDGGILRTTTGITSARAVTLDAGGGTFDSNGVNSTLSGLISGSGDFTKTGTGNLILSNAGNSFTGTINVTGGLLQISNTGNLGNAANELLLDGGGLRFGAASTLSRLITLNAGNGTIDTNGFNVTLASEVSGTGGLTKIGTGTLTLNDTSYTGHTTVNAGTLQGTTDTITGDVTTNATLTFNQSTDGEHAGDIDGTGALIKTGTGNVTLSGTNTYSGGTTVTNGTLTGDTVSLQGLITNNADLVFDQISDGSFAGAISGAGDVTKDGAGNLTVTGTNTYSGDTFIIDGTLSVNGALANSIATIASGGRLAGTGTVGGIVANAGGIVAPGNSIGTLNVTGDVTFNTGSFFDVEIDANGNADMIDATGDAFLNGGTVRVRGLAGVYPAVSIYTILVGTNVSGAFDDIIANVPWLQPVLTYNANNVVMTVTALPIDLMSSATNENARSVADLIERQGPGTDLYNALFVLTPEEQQQALAQLSGEQHATDVAQIAASTTQLGDTLFNVMAFSHPLSGFNRLQSDYDRGASPDLIEPAAGGREDRYIWAHLLKFKGSTNSTGIASDTERDGNGVMAGMDWILNGNSYAGTFMSVQDNTLETSDVGSRTDARSITGGFYHGYEGPTGISWKGLAAFTRHSLKTTRLIVFPGFNQTAESKRDGFSIQAQGEASKAFPLANNVTYAPFAGLKIAYTNMENTTEANAGAAALTINSDRMFDLASTLGARLRYHLVMPEGQKWFLETQAGWQHRYGQTAASNTNAFASLPGNFTSTSEDLPRDSAIFSVNTGIVIKGGTELTLGYWGQLAKDSQDHGLRLSARADF